MVLAFAALPADAQQEAGIVRVSVADAATGRALALVRIFLRGGETQYAYTDTTGTATFDRVPTGTYTLRLEKSGYRAAEHGALVVASGRETTVQASLAQISQPKVIGSVRVRSSVAISRGDVDATSAANRLSSGLGEALSSLPDLTAVADGFSIDGRDPAQTSLQIDGVPIPGLGAGQGIRGIDADLFGGASVSTGSTNGALGGGINLRSLEPTLAFQAQGDATLSARDSSSVRASIRGTSGSIGFVYTHAARGANDVLNGLAFRDASGLDYVHANGAFQGGDLLKLRAPIGSHQSITVTTIRAHADQDEVCNRLAGPLPCGYGPGNLDALSSQTDLFAYKANAGSTELAFNAGRFAQRRFNNGSNRLVNGISDPASAASQFAGTVLTLRGIAPVRSLDVVSASVTSLNAAVDARYASPFAATASTSTRYVTADVRDLHQLGGDASLDLTLGGESSTGSKNVFAKLGVQVKHGANTLRVNAEAGQGGSAVTTTAPPFDPAVFVYDCPARAVFGTAAGDPPGKRDSRAVDASFTRRGDRVTWDAGLYAQEIRGSAISTFLDAASAPSALPPAFAQALSSFYATPAGCGSTAPLGAANTYLLQSVGVDRLEYSGARIGVSGSLGRSVVGGVFGTLQRAAAYGSDPRFGVPQSIVRPGHELPNVPTMRASGVVDYRAAHSPLEALGLLQYTSANNPRNLPAYSMLTLGLAYETLHGTLTVALQNATNAFAGRFVSPAYAVPLPTVGGSGLPTLAQPLAPRSVQVSYSVRAGSYRSRATVGLGETAAGSETAMQAPLRALPASPPADPLALALDDPRCTPERVPGARRVVSVLRDAATKLEAQRAQTGTYPAAFSAAIPADLEMTARYVKTARSYAFALTFKRNTLRSVGACLPLAYTNAESSAQHDLPPLDGGANEQFGYSPLVGFYFQTAGAPINAGVIASSKRALDAPPAEPLTPLPSCSVRFRPVANAIAEALRSGKTTAGDLPGVAISRRSHGFASWYELRFANVSDEAAAESCFAVANTTAEELRSRGYEASRFPVLNYADPFGFYVVR
jgi:Carboxypeptidase regulatory-like domain